MSFAGSAADALPHDTHRTCGWVGVWTGADIDLENDWGELEKIGLREMVCERMAAGLTFGHIHLHFLITSPADEDNAGGTRSLNRPWDMDSSAFPKSSASSTVKIQFDSRRRGYQLADTLPYSTPKIDYERVLQPFTFRLSRT